MANEDRDYRDTRDREYRERVERRIRHEQAFKY